MSRLRTSTIRVRLHPIRSKAPRRPLNGVLPVLVSSENGSPLAASSLWLFTFKHDLIQANWKRGAVGWARLNRPLCSSRLTLGARPFQPPTDSLISFRGADRDHIFQSSLFVRSCASSYALLPPGCVGSGAESCVVEQPSKRSHPKVYSSRILSRAPNRSEATGANHRSGSDPQ